MKDADVAARLVEALNAAAGANTTLVSVEITMLTRGEIAAVAATLTRKTKTLAFMSAECVSVSGERLAAAASVHKVAG